MDTRLVVSRTLPDGRRTMVFPFHVSLEGLESATICRDEEDYDVMVKNIFLCARRNNIIVVIYSVVSNHAHIAILGENIITARRFSDRLKQVQSMWLHRKYGDEKLLFRKKADVSIIDTVQYARNVLAYIPRNALDNGAKNIAEYKWTGFLAMFSENKPSPGMIPVKSLSTREIARYLHTGDRLSDVGWYLNTDGTLNPICACDNNYLESIFNHDQTFFLRTIGSVNSSEMKYLSSMAKSRKMNDAEFLKTVNELSQEWYHKEARDLPPDGKARFIEYLQKKYYLSVPQVARCLNMKREDVSVLLGKQNSH